MNFGRRNCLERFPCSASLPAGMIPRNPRSIMPLVDSTKWRAAELSVKQLHFLQDNPRLTDTGPKSDAQIIEELCDGEAIDDLAAKMASMGYLRTERPIVVFEDEKHVVYEGNRRLCALKLLLNPELAPPKRQETFRKLAERANAPRKIHVDVVPTRFDAEVAMYAKHAVQRYSIGWSPLQQANWIVQQFKLGRSAEDLGRMGVPASELEHAAAAVDFFNLCRLAPGPGADRIRRDPREWPYSVVFDRLVKPKAPRKALGLEYTPNGLAVPPEPEFLETLGRILDDAVDRQSIDTRKLGKEQQQLEYVQSLKFSPSKKRSTVSELVASRSSDSAPPEATPKIPSRKKSSLAKASDSLVPRSLGCKYSDLKLLQLLAEAKKLRIEERPLTSGVMLRCLLELALHTWLKAHNQHGQLGKHHKSAPDDVGVGLILSDLNEGLISNFELDSDVKRALPTLIGKTGPLSFDSLHLYVHNPRWSGNADHVRQMREILLPILRTALTT